MTERRTEEVRSVLYIDRALGEVVNGLANEPHPWVALAGTLASQRVRDGSVCVALADLARSTPEAGAFGIDVWPELAAWQAVLWASGVVSDGSSVAPLVLDSRGRLYLYRYWLAERSVAQRIFERTSAPGEAVPPESMGRWLDELFPGVPEQPDWQRVAAVTAALGRLAVIVGGPGTGKTSTVVRLLALLALQAEHSGAPPPRAALLAPTGKAAQRLVESIQRAKARLALPTRILHAIPEAASTLHRALNLGRRFDALGRAELPEPLVADIVIVDEASMADLATLSALFDAVPSRARLVILGDDRQLASVEAGSVLGELTSPARGLPYSADRSQLLEQLGCGRISGPPSDSFGAVQTLRDQIVELVRSHRFDAESGIGALVRALRLGVVRDVMDVLECPDYSDVEWIELAPGASVDSRFDCAVCRGYSPFVEAASPREALGALARFRVLAAHRRGQFGVEGLTARVERALASQGLQTPVRDYPRRPVLVTENSYRLELYNGDVGVLWKGATGATRAHFVSGDGAERILPVPRLPEHETALVMSVHKSQGSEFSDVLCVLPAEASPLLTRELLYTAVSRAKERLCLFASRASLAAAVERTVQRSSGLGSLVWEGCPG